MNSSTKNEQNPIGIKAAYIFGIAVSICSIYISGFDDKPLKDKENNAIKSYKSKLSPDTTHHYLKNQDSSTMQMGNILIPKIKNTIKIPIDKRTSDASGTAFKMGKEAWITARHVIHGCQKVYLSNKPIENIFIPPSSDLALLISDAFDVEKFELNWSPNKNNFTKYQKDLVIGDLGYSVGFPKGDPGQARLKFAGYVQMIQKGAYYLKEPVKMWVETQRQPKSLDQMGGISGGPIFNNAGSIVGVHVANSVRRGRAFSVDESAISWLLSATPKTNELTRKKPKTQISDKNWSEKANFFRNSGRIKKVICSID